MISNEESPTLGALARKYSGPGPRYTSYPTAMELSPMFGEAQWLDALAQDEELAAGAPVALYLHLPFCRSLCYFCACNRVITQDKALVEPYLRALEAEAKRYASVLRGAPLEQLHLGGGTPNFLSAGQLERLFALLQLHFPRRLPDFEASVELDPRTVNAEQLSLLRALGVTRISFGIQDFDPRVQRAVNRIQPYELVREHYAHARTLGFEGINFDLIYGLPQQTLPSFSETIQKVLALRPDRIALYGYAHVPWLNKAQRALERSNLPDPALRIALLEAAIAGLAGGGYHHIGMDHFALPDDPLMLARQTGRLRRNFMGYTTQRGARTIGLGMGAISEFPGALAQNEKILAAYQETACAGRLPTARGLKRNADDRLREDVIKQILCSGAVDVRQVEARWSVSFWRYFADALPRLQLLEDEGIILLGDEMLRATPLGTRFLRHIAMPFDAYLARHEAREKPVFSQTM